MADGKWTGTFPQCQRMCFNNKELLYPYSCSRKIPSHCSNHTALIQKSPLVQKLVRKNQAECCIFGFICVGFREIQFKGPYKRSGSGMLFTAGGKMIIHSNSSSPCTKRGHCHAFVLMQGFAITYPANTLDWKAIILSEKPSKTH